MTEEAIQSDYAEAWRPNPGDTITGVVKNIEAIDPSGQGVYPCVTVQTAAGEMKAIHAFRQVLRTGLAKCQPKPGDEITITYGGKKMGANREYHDYRVLGGQPRDFSWDSFLPEGDRPPEPAQNLAAPPIAPSQPAAEPTVQERAATAYPGVPF